MGKALFDAYPAVRRLFEEGSDLLGMDFRRLCFEGPDSDLVRTENVQPAITLVALAAAEVLRQEGIVASAAAGHSVGEYAALCTAGVFSFADTMRLVRIRGTAMQAAADRHPGGMAAVLGLDSASVAALNEELQGIGSAAVANYNSPSQVVLTGSADGLEAAVALAKKRGARLVVPLKVSGPWHSPFMAEAQEPIRDALERCGMRAPSVPVRANVSGDSYPQDPSRIREMLVDQIVRPVLWSRSMSGLVADGHRTFVEVGPGTVLTRLMKEISRELAVWSVPDPDGVAKALKAGESLAK
jgi:[acyl-carrier-protein] S-malonyltransferase